jgi:UDP-N-acetylglucosamine kinase
MSSGAIPDLAWTVSAEDIVRVVFPESSSADDPVLVVVIRPPGSMTAPVTGRLVVEHGPDIAVLNGDDLRAMHPAIADGSPAVEAVQSETADWLRACLAFARENHRSLILEGQFSPAAVLGITDRFSGEGFRTRVVISGARRAECLLSAVSHYLRSVQSGVGVRFVSRDAVERELDSVRMLTAALESADAVGRVSVASRDGKILFDAERGAGERPFQGASAALGVAQSEQLTSLQSAQWLSELRRVTDYTATLRDAPRALVEALVDLHETALREIIPELPVPAGSKAAAAQERRAAAELVALRRSLSSTSPVDVAAPVVGPEGPDRGGISR